MISGVTESDGSDSYILKKAKETFLLDKNRYRYIGIIRLKIDYRILIGPKYAIKTVQKIKKEIRRLFDCRKEKIPNSRCDYFVIDCFDNDELSVIAFSDELLTLFNFLGNIRSIKTSDIKQPYRENGNKKVSEKHVFGLTYLAFGYDTKCGFGEDVVNDNKIVCTIETKPGHRDVFYDYLCGIPNQSPEIQKLGIIDKSMIISGGSNVMFRMPLKNITILEYLCKNQNSIFRRDIRRIKVSLEDIPLPSDQRDLSKISKNHIHAGEKERISISREHFIQVKKLMKEVGVSKMVRERMLALFEFYNLSCQNLLQGFYLNELKPILENVESMIKDMENNPNEDIYSIEKMLNSEITDLENACYDRLHIQNSNHTPLEYSGGIQQYLTSFDFAYKQIYRIFSPNDKDASYVTISGAERASSTRPLFNLNINDIVYPELFIVLVWKEIANFALQTMKKYEEKNNAKDQIKTLNAWYGFTKNEDSFHILWNKIHQSEKLLHDDEISRRIKKIISTELIEYYIKDYVVFHFAFNCNFDLFWHYYFKILLQTTNSYYRLNHINKNHLIHMLLRVFMVAKVASMSEGLAQLQDFLEKHSRIPFDHIWGGEWVECYQKTRLATDEIYSVLEMYGFQEVITYVVGEYEKNVVTQDSPETDIGITQDMLNSAQEKREKMIEKIRDKLYAGQLIQAEPSTDGRYDRFSFLISLFGGYLRAIYSLDFHQGVNCPIKSIPRNQEGEVLLRKRDKAIFDNMIQIPADTTGGFFIPSYTTRKQYFCLRTALYRSLWNYRFMFGEKK